MLFARTTEEKRMRRIVKIVVFLVVMGVGLPLGGFSQINTDRVLSIGRNALYFEDYVLSIQYFNQVIRVKPYLPEPYFYRAVAKISLEGRTRKSRKGKARDGKNSQRKECCHFDYCRIDRNF